MSKFKQDKRKLKAIKRLKALRKFDRSLGLWKKREAPEEIDAATRDFIRSIARAT